MDRDKSQLASSTPATRGPTTNVVKKSIFTRDAHLHHGRCIVVNAKIRVDELLNHAVEPPAVPHHGHDALKLWRQLLVSHKFVKALILPLWGRRRQESQKFAVRHARKSVEKGTVRRERAHSAGVDGYIRQEGSRLEIMVNCAVGIPLVLYV